MTTIGILWPGAMGSALGRAWRTGGARVVTTVAGRSERTRRLAGDLELLPSPEDVVASADLVVSVVPPERALAQAHEIAAAVRATGSTPTVADLNAVSPMTMAAVAQVLEPVGCRVVDGAISGGPPREGGDTVLFLAGPDCHPLDQLTGPGLRPLVVSGEVGAASAAKMCTAAIYKGTKGLLLASLSTAHHHGVLDTVVADLSRELPEVMDDVARDLAVAVAKSDRFPGEMREIAATQGAAGGSPELYEAMALVYERAHATPLARRTPEEAADADDLVAVLDALRPRPGPRPGG